MGPSIGPIVLLYSLFTTVPPYIPDPANPNDPPPIVHVELPANVNQIRMTSNSMVWIMPAFEAHPDVVVRNSLDRGLNGQWGKFVACNMTTWDTCDITIGPFEADVTDAYLVFWGPDAFSSPDPNDYRPAQVNLVATRIEEPNFQPEVNVEVHLFDWIIRRPRRR